MTSRPLFTDREVNLARVCLVSVEAQDCFHITEPERRACDAVVRYAELGEPILQDDLQIARALFDAIARETKGPATSAPAT